jgi:hypothetical protein
MTAERTLPYQEKSGKHSILYPQLTHQTKPDENNIPYQNKENTQSKGNTQYINPHTTHHPKPTEKYSLTNTSTENKSHIIFINIFRSLTI